MGLAFNQDETTEEKFHRFLEHARKNDKARKHHVIPASYLKRWATTGKLQVTDLMTGESRPLSPDTAARVTDFYRVESPDLDSDDYPPLLIENLLGYIEDRAKPSLDAILSKGVQELTDLERFDIAMFMGFQLVRGQRTRGFAKEASESFFRMQYEDLAPEAVREMLNSRGKEATDDEVASFGEFQTLLKQGKVKATAQKAALVTMPLQYAEKIAEILYVRNWVLFRTRPILLTCDEPVITIGGPGTDRHVVAGVERAHVVIFPIAPNALLAAFRPRVKSHWCKELNLCELAEINLEISGAAHRWAFDREGRLAAKRFDLPAQPARPLRFEERSIEGGSGNDTIVRGFRINRWAQSSTPPGWPVSRWYV